MMSKGELLVETDSYYLIDAGDGHTHIQDDNGERNIIVMDDDLIKALDEKGQEFHN